MSENTTQAAPAVIEAPEASETNSPELEAGAEEGSEEGQETAAETKPTPKPEPKRSSTRKIKLKVDGQELEEEVNLDDEEYLRRELQLAKVAQKRMGEYANLEKRVQAFLEDLRNNPRKVLTDPSLGIDMKAVIAEIINEEAENSKKSPEQLEREKLEKELQSLKDEREKEKEDFKRKEFERLQSQAYEQYDVQMTKALEKSDLPKSPYTIKKMADYMLLALQENIDVSPEDVLPLVRQELQSDLKEMFALMPDEVIESIVGKDVIGRIRKKSVTKAKEMAAKVKPKTPGVKEGDSKTAGKQSFKQFFGV